MIAIGNDLQWERLTGLAPFEALANTRRKTNAGRHKQRQAIHRQVTDVTLRHTTAELAGMFSSANIPHAPINTIDQVRNTDALKPKLTTTRAPDGTQVHLPPLAVDIADAPNEYHFAPRYSEHTTSILSEAGLTKSTIADLEANGVIPWCT